MQHTGVHTSIPRYKKRSVTKARPRLRTNHWINHFPYDSLPANAIKHRGGDTVVDPSVWRKRPWEFDVRTVPPEAFRGNLKVYEGIRDHEHSLWRANKQAASSTIALCCRLELPLVACMCVHVHVRADMYGDPLHPQEPPPLFTSASARPPSNVQPFLIASSTVRALNYGVAQASTQPDHLPSGYAARAHIRYVHF